MKINLQNITVSKIIQWIFNVLLVITTLIGIVSFIIFITVFKKFSTDSDDWTFFAGIFSGLLGTSFGALTLFYLIVDRMETKKEKIEEELKKLVNDYIHDYSEIHSSIIDNNNEKILENIQTALEKKSPELIVYYLEKYEIDKFPEEIKNRLLKTKDRFAPNKQWNELDAKEKYFIVRKIDPLDFKKIFEYFKMDIEQMKKDNVSSLNEKLMFGIIGSLGIENDYFKSMYIASFEHFFDETTSFIRLYKAFRYHVLNIKNYNEGLLYYLNFITYTEKKLFTYFSILRKDSELIERLINTGFYGYDMKSNFENTNLIYGIYDVENLKKFLLFTKYKTQDLPTYEPNYFDYSDQDIFGDLISTENTESV